MTWITKLAYQRDLAAHQRRIFDLEVSELWRSLRIRMGNCADSYERMYPHAQHHVLAQWDANHDVFKCSAPDANGAYNDEKWRVTLTRNDSVIKASYSTSRPEIQLVVGRAEDGHAVLQSGGSEISLDEATERILRPILFDDLPEA